MLSSAIEQPESPAYVSILGVHVGRFSQTQAIERIDQLIVRFRASVNETSNANGSSTVSCQQVVTVNTEFVMEAQHNLPFRQCINEAALTVADGAGLVWASRYLHQPIAERVTGTDLLAALARHCAERGYNLYLLGAAPGIAVNVCNSSIRVCVSLAHMLAHLL